MSGKHAVSRSIYWEASNGIFLPYYCLVCWWHQSSGEGPNKLGSASKVYNFIGNRCWKWYQLFVLSPFSAEILSGKLFQQAHTATFKQSCSVRFVFESDAYSEKMTIVISYLKSSYISSSSLWSVWIAETRHVANLGILTKEILFFNRKAFWAIVRIDEKPSSRIWLSTYWSSTIFLFPFSQQKDSLCVENKMIVSKRCLVSYRSF